MHDSSGATIDFPDPTPPVDASLVAAVAELVVAVYRVAEADLWVDGVERTTPAEVAHLVEHGELAIARVDGELAGCAHVHAVAADTCSIGMLVAAPGRRGEGIGRDLLAFGEQTARSRGFAVAQVELLVPKAWTHPDKERLARWYDRLGFRVTRLADLTETHPHLAPLLATPCDLQIRQKPLDG